jgi:hypothetical protein
MPILPLPQVTKSTNTPTNTSDADSSILMHGAVDSDWAGDTKHQKSVSGIILHITGGTILYKTKYQDTVALPTTEAEFNAACDAGKCILYVRSILDGKDFYITCKKQNRIDCHNSFIIELFEKLSQEETVVVQKLKEMQQKVQRNDNTPIYMQKMRDLSNKCRD